jgi:hypothetical protein
MCLSKNGREPLPWRRIDSVKRRKQESDKEQPAEWTLASGPREKQRNQESPHQPDGRVEPGKEDTGYGSQCGVGHGIPCQAALERDEQPDTQERWGVRA